MEVFERVEVFVEVDLGTVPPDRPDSEKFGSANGTRTRISALRGPRANLCTIAPDCLS